MNSLWTTQASIDTVHSFLSHPLGRTHYHRLGPDPAPVVVLVSGATLPMAVWEPLLAPLVEAGFQVVRYDLPGRGHSSSPGWGLDFDAHLGQLHHLLDGLGLREPVRLVGLASGALLVAAYAQRHRERVSHAALMAPDGAATRFTLTERLLSTPVLGTLLFRASAARTLLARVPRYSSRADVQAFVRELLAFSMRSAGFHQAVLATVRTFPLHEGEAQYRQLRQTGVPTLIVWGREDRITPPNAAPEMEAWFGRAAMHVMEAVGHLPFVEDPASVAALLGRHFRPAH